MTFDATSRQQYKTREARPDVEGEGSRYLVETGTCAGDMSGKPDHSVNLC